LDDCARFACGSGPPAVPSVISVVSADAWLAAPSAMNAASSNGRAFHLSPFLSSYAGELNLSVRHGRACPGHPRLAFATVKTWMPGTRPGMTIWFWRKREAIAHPKFNSLKKSFPLSSMTTNAGKSTTSMRQIASMPSSGYSTVSTFLMQCSARFAAAPPIEAR
jgi:hypothetical protein